MSSSEMLVFITLSDVPTNRVFITCRYMGSKFNQEAMLTLKSKHKSDTLAVATTKPSLRKETKSQFNAQQSSSTPCSCSVFKWKVLSCNMPSPPGTFYLGA